MTEPFVLYHWAPTARRKQITRHGLRPSSRSVDGLWKPPYVCFSDNPSLAWSLSGRFHPEITPWDLWMTWSDVPAGYEALPFDGGAAGVKEYRVYERIYKRNLWRVGSRPGWSSAATQEAAQP